MFSFFKRFKGSKTPDTVQPSSEPAEEAVARESAAPTPPAPEPARVPSSAPATPSFAPQPQQPMQPPPVPQPPAAVPSVAARPEVAPPATVPHVPAQPTAQPSASAPPAAPAPAAAVAAPAPAAATAEARIEAHLATPDVDESPELETVEIVPPPAPEPEEKRSWLKRLRSGLSKTSASLTGLFVGTKIDEMLYEELETALLVSDAGVEATEYLLGALREKVRAEKLTDPQQVKTALRTLIVNLLKPLEKSLVLGRAQPLVVMIAGVNGAGKTTSIGKLAKHLQHYQQSVLLAAGDTFRAAAREQLAIWGERNNVTVVAQESGDPAAVIFDAVSAARARKIDVVMADTAGRLPTQLHLMEELRKVKRVIGKAHDGAPHEILLVIDANTGQNALAQVKAFDDALSLTGLIVTKLDGTAKGGILAAIARQRPVPVYFIGVGEKVEDLQPFDAEEFTDALLG